MREAFVTSVTCVVPPVSFQMSHESTVPNASPCWERPARSRIHSSLLAEKYGSQTSPVRRANQFRGKPGASLGRPAVLPDDRSMDRRAGCAIPHDRGLPLVRDPDRRELGGPDAGAGERALGRDDSARPELLGVVLHPTGRGKVLRQLDIAATTHLQHLVDDETRRPGRPLIDREQHRRAF